MQLSQIRRLLSAPGLRPINATSPNRTVNHSTTDIRSVEHFGIQNSLTKAFAQFPTFKKIDVSPWVGTLGCRRVLTRMLRRQKQPSERNKTPVVTAEQSRSNPIEVDHFGVKE